jgi:hypothetical protein
MPTNQQHSRHQNFKAEHFDYVSYFFNGLTGLATLLILTILGVMLGNIVINGWSGFSWRFITTIPKGISSNPPPRAFCR